MAIRYGADKAADQTQINQLKQVSENLKEELQRVYELVSVRKNDYDELSEQVVDFFGIRLKQARVVWEPEEELRWA